MGRDYFFTDIPLEISITKLVTIHYFEFGRDYVFDGESHDFWELFYIDSGKAEIEYGGSIYQLNQNDIMLYAPNIFHKIRSLDSNLDLLCISFECGSPYMELLANIRTKASREIKQLFSRIIYEASEAFVLENNNPGMSGLKPRPDAPFASVELIKLYLQTALILLIRELGKKSSGTRSGQALSENRTANDIAAYIDERCEGKLTVGDICRDFGFSATYVERIFREATDMSVMRYCNAKRIERAKKYIKSGNMNFTQISERLGFDNPQYFSRVFRRITRLSPTEYRYSLQIK